MPKVTSGDERLKKLEERRAMLDQRINRLKAREANQDRKNETRRKVLVGAVILEMVKKNEWPEDKLLSLLDRSLIHPRDRVLFGLSIPDVKRPKTEEATFRS